jgi:hypothetical protein
MILASGITTNQVAGAIALALLRDLRVNNFTFQGFPEIRVTYKDKVFDVRLRIQDAEIGPFSLTEKEGTALAKQLNKDGQVEDTFFPKVQGWVQELELAAEK